ncbi:MAG: sodium-independent anion transporter [Micrococcales bacterium 73-13]|nr:MAG: sodium-independent anion transporter [Micrococcales bacterium 73-13]
MRLVGYVRSLVPGPDDYRALPRTWRLDLLAGLTVGIVALPLALAFGVSSGVGAAAGLVTAIVAGAVAAVFGGSNVQVSGPTGAMVVVLAPIVAAHGVGAVATVSLLAGVIVLVVGLLKLGRLVTIIPWPVIEGFTLGIAVIIFLQQVPNALGVGDFNGLDHSTNALVAAIQSISMADLAVLPWTLGLVAAVAAVMVAAPFLHRHLPGSIIAIILVSVVAFLAQAPVDRIGALPSALPPPSVPPLDWPTVQQLIAPALTVAALAAIESLLSARVASTLADTGHVDADRELVGQGLASVASGLFGGMPATGAIARTAVNVRSGGRTRLASVTHAVVLLLVVYLAASVVAEIPLAALSGVLMVTSVRMVTPSTVRAVVRASRGDAFVFGLTAVVTIAFDLIIAVAIGLVVAAVLALRALARSGSASREPLPGPAQAGDERIALFRLDGAMFFGAAEAVAAEVERVHGGVEVVVVRMSQIGSLDATGARVITELVQALERRGVTVLLKGIQARHLALAKRVGILDSLRHHKHLFDELPPAVEHARDHVRRAEAARAAEPSA